MKIRLTELDKSNKTLMSFKKDSMIKNKELETK